MTSIRKTARSAMSIYSVLLISLAAIAPIAAYGQTKPLVTVINPVTNPVNTRITNAVMPVEVSNADPIVVRIEETEGRREIFSQTIIVEMTPQVNLRCNQTDLLVVPSGKRLVIEYVSARVHFGTPSELVSVGLAEAATLRFLLLVPGITSLANNSDSFAAAGQYVHTYSDGTLAVCATATDVVLPANVSVNVTGYFVAKS